MQIYKNYAGLKLFVSSVQTGQYNSFPRLRKFSPVLLNEFQFWKFHILFNIGIWCMHVNQIIVQSL
jgi:hypothetical protein